MILFCSTVSPPAEAGFCYRIETSTIITGTLYPSATLPQHDAFHRARGLILLNRLDEAKACLEAAGLECLPACRDSVERNFDVAFFRIPEDT